MMVLYLCLTILCDIRQSWFIRADCWSRDTTSEKYRNLDFRKVVFCCLLEGNQQLTN